MFIDNNELKSEIAKLKEVEIQLTQANQKKLEDLSERQKQIESNI